MSDKDWIFEYLQGYAQKDMVRFHMPGHKGGRAFSTHERKSGQFDITELQGSDNLLAANGIIDRAQKDAAKAFGAKRTFFVTTGATTALLAMVLSLPQGSKVLLSRDCHKSIISALVLAGHDLVFLPIDNCQELVDTAQIQAALKKDTTINAFLLTRPDYWGRCADVETISLLCDRHKCMLLVDEAHGAHFPFSKRLPNSASKYADIWVQSAHKTLGAWNQCAYLHLGKKSTEEMEERLFRALKLLHTTSPSYPMLSALEQAWKQAKSGIWDEHITRLETWKANLPETLAQACTKSEKYHKAAQYDSTRLVFDVASLGMSGYALDAFLWKKNIALEMSDLNSIVCITTPFDPDDWYLRLEEGLQDALHQIAPEEAENLPALPLAEPERVMPLREAALASLEECDLDDAENKICAQAAGFYPPGYAIITPGERISPEIINCFKQGMAAGANCFGLPLLCVK